MVSNLDAVGVLINCVGKLLCAARAVLLDCEATRREPTPEERELLDGLAFLAGDGSRPVGAIPRPRP